MDQIKVLAVKRKFLEKNKIKKIIIYNNNIDDIIINEIFIY